ncbi:MAG: 23S rRNA (adenine(2503)-C(2))-methyltransferase RlmN [Pirellula sp.]|nr:23S rRNA (adenine(2503)-C(2))-methyltransferase RlmN [Pirellula sp.]
MACGNEHVDLLNLDLASLALQLKAWGIATAHAGHLRRYLYRDGVRDFAAMHELPPRVRAQLAESATITTFAIERESRADDGLTRKYLLRLHDGRQIETVLMRTGRRTTVCVSSQAGCPLGCVFCATGQAGFDRNLTAGEIAGQALFAQQVLRDAGAVRNDGAPDRVSNIVVMGMGEPLLNYDAVMTALDNLCDPGGLAIGFKQVTISTVGVVPGIFRMASERRPYSLAVSLHGATQTDRLRLLPVARTWSLEELMDACRRYAAALHRKIFFEWTVIAGENDGAEHAAALAELLHGIPAQVNLIPLNPTTGYAGSTAADSAVATFRELLQASGIKVSIRQRRGIEIAAGCGQLAASPNA